jgi:hypothetical protein
MSKGSKSFRTCIMGFCDSIAMRKHTALEFSWIPAITWLSLCEDTRTLPVLAVFVLLQILINFVIANFRWRMVNKWKQFNKDGGLLPPQYPSLIPYLGNALSFVWNNANFVRQAT